MAGTPESKVKKVVKQRLKARGIWYYAPVQMGMGVVGIPDFICCMPVLITSDMVGKTFGKFLAVETKAPGKLEQLTPNQAARLEEIRSAGGAVLVIDDADLLNQLKESESGNPNAAGNGSNSASG
jgi:hypothetical protein